jgi:anti-sigma factor RsiW
VKKRTDELLAAYADGGLAPDEAAEVEALLAKSPEARAELEAIRRLLAEARSAEARSSEPDWDQMARSIHSAALAAPAPRLAWLWRPRRVLAIGALAAVAAAAVLFVILRGGQPDRAPREAATTPVAPAASAHTESAADPLPALREPEVDELSADELADLEGELDADDLGDDGFIADLLAAGDSGDEEADEPEAFAVFDDNPLTADELADELPADAIEKIDRFLAEASAG